METFLAAGILLLETARDQLEPLIFGQDRLHQMPEISTPDKGKEIYLKVFRFGNPAWFYLHVACQVSAYIIGVAGWATGIDLSSGISSLNRDYIHRNIGIALFFLATVQVFALLLRPKPDHKYRLYWNVYHWAVGYAIIVTSVFNVLKGLSLLDPEIQWWHAYIVTAISSGIISAALEAITWTIVVKRKKANEEKQNQRTNGVNEANGHAARTVRLEPEV